MLNRVKQWWEDIKAWRRGERRVAPTGARGRVYVPVRVGGSDHVEAKAEPKPIVNLRVYRAQEQAWYRHDALTGQLVRE